MKVCVRPGPFRGAVLLMIVLSGGCASAVKKSVEVELNQTAWVSSGGGVPVARKKGEAVTVADEPVLIEAPGHLGVLLVPVENRSAKAKITLRPVENWGGEKFSGRMNRVLNDALFSVNEIQGLLAAGRPKEALAKVEVLQERYPKLASLGFLRASCLIVLGRNADAKAVLESTLAQFPNDARAQQLHRAFLQGSGGNRSISAETPEELEEEESSQ